VRDRDTPSPPRGATRPGFAKFFGPKTRAQGKPGARCTRGRAWSVVNTRVSHHRFTGTPGLPCAMVLTVSFGLLCDRALLSPSLMDHSTNLTPASGRQDHTTSPSALAPFVFRRCCVHRIPPRVRDDRETPSDRDGICLMYCCFYQSEKQNIFRERAGHKIAKRARRANHAFIYGPAKPAMLPIGTLETCRLALRMSVRREDRKSSRRGQNDEIEPQRRWSSPVRSALGYEEIAVGFEWPS
jgi:hypothetical protein